MRKLLFFSLFCLTLFACNTTKDLVSTPVVPKDQSLTEQTVSAPTIKGHIYYLASDEMGGRNTPSPELNIAARYLATSLMRYGVQPVSGATDYLQSVPMKKVYPPTDGTFTFDNQTLALGKDFLIFNNSSIDATSDVVFINRGTAQDYEGKEVSGKILISIAGYEGQENPQEWFFTGQEKQELAKERGAKALIEIYKSAQLPWSVLLNFLGQPQITINDQEDSDTAEMPYGWLSVEDASVIGMLTAADGLQGTLQVAKREEETFDSYNVVGIVEGSDPQLKEEYIIYSAHYDHVGIGRADAAGDSLYNGARDNAVGSVTVLSAAENIAKYPTKRSAIFIFFTGEEKGLLGSAYYADHPSIPLDKVVYCFNSDNAGYNDTTRASIIGLTRTNAQPLIEKACATFGLKAMEDAAPEQGLFDRSDNVNFAKKGVPAPTFSLGYTSFDDKINQYYHQPGDEPATLDYDYLTKFFKSYVYACRLIGNTNQSLFWKEGDKYFEAGMKLYENKN